MGIVLNIAALYLMVGILFGLFFILKGVKSLDENTHGTSFWFRLLIFPGTVALWPILLYKSIRK